MTTLLSPPLITRGGDWQYGLDELALAGVQLSTEQLALLDTGERMMVMAAWPVPDPSDWAVYPEHPSRPLAVSDTIHGPTYRPTIPVLAETDPSFRHALRVGNPAGARFPSVVARLTMPDSSYESCSPPVYIRAWDLVPIPTTELWPEVISAAQQWWRYSEYAALRDYWLVWANELDDCALAISYGREPTAHTHKPVPHIPRLTKCIDGEEAFGALQRDLFWHGDPQHGVRGFTPELSWQHDSLRELWSELAASSRVAAEQALRVVPPWQVDDLRRLEQEGGRPWW